MKKIKNLILKKWDWWIYRMAYRSINRICARDPAYAYLLKKNIDDWLDAHPVPASVKSAADKFHDALKTHKPH